MKWSLLSWLLLNIQLGLFAVTAFVAPFILRPRFLSYLAYSVIACVLWLAYAIGALICDGKIGNDVPGAGYLLVGFVGWCIGSVGFVLKVIRAKS